MNGLASSRGLRRRHFRQVAPNGFGDSLNSYAHTMAWFEEQLYVGTTRANLCMIKVSNPISLRRWPVRCPQHLYDLDRRAQVWRFQPRANEWQRVLISPHSTGEDGRQIPRDIGYRGMAVFQARSDSKPALYVCAWSPSRAQRPPAVLRSRDGSSFSPVSSPQGSAAHNTYRALLPLDGHIYTSPAGSTRGWQGDVFRGSKENMSGVPIVFSSSDPERIGWRPISSLGFGDPANTTVFEMVAFNGDLYASTLNPTRGFQLWKTKPAGRYPHRWIRVLTQGAYRGALNQAAICMCVFAGALYVGTGIQNGGYDRTYQIGPAAAEVLRVYPDDTWDLIVGAPRRTPHGVKLPLSGMAPGFDDFFNGYVWRMAVHDGWLYATTFNWSVFLPYLRIERWPPFAQALVAAYGIDNIIADRGGFDLWRTQDGVTWVPVTLDGFNNPYNYGGRTLTSTPHGLFVGTANPFAPEVAIQTDQGWREVANPKGGLEIWLGAESQED